MKKRILIFSTAYYPFVGGAEVAIKEITNRLGETFDFDMVTLRFDRNLPKFERVGNVNVYRLGFTSNSPMMSDLVKFPLKINKILFPFLAWRKAISLQSEKKYDGIWAMMAAFAGFSAVFFKFSYPRVPYLLTLQEGDSIPEIKKKVRFVYPLFKKIFTKADRIQVISNYLGEWAKEMGGKNIEIIPNAVNVASFSEIYSLEELNYLRNIWGGENDKFIITTSRLVKKNAIDDVIKSLKYLPENFKFIILGDGPDWKNLEKLAVEKGVRERVKFLGVINQEEIPQYLKASDIFIRPSLSEGFGNSFIEAMASEIPVVATPVGGIVDFLKDKETGLFCEVRNPKDIAKKIQFILDFQNQNFKKQIIKNAKNMVVQKYDWNIIAKDIKDKVFDKLI